MDDCIAGPSWADIRDEIPRLPPSKLIRRAVADAKIAIGEGHRLEAFVWVKRILPYVHSRCAVCFAGAILVRGLLPEDQLTLSDLPKPLAAAMFALDNFRVGQYTNGLNFMGRGMTSELQDDLHGMQYPPPMTREPQKFFDHMEQVADIFQAHGL